MGVFEKPEVNVKEAISLIIHSVWAIVYHLAVWIKNNWDRIIHIVSFVVFSILLSITGYPIFGFLAVVPAVIYPFIWALIIKRKV